MCQGEKNSGKCRARSRAAVPRLSGLGPVTVGLQPDISLRRDWESQYRLTTLTLRSLWPSPRKMSQPTLRFPCSKMEHGGLHRWNNLFLPCHDRISFSMSDGEPRLLRYSL
jgi:hypothetical protein